MSSNNLSGVLPKRVANLLAILAAAAAPIVPAMGQGIVTNWVAFNDHVAGDATALNVTPYNLWTGPGGYLTNYSAANEYAAGQELLVKVDVSYTGSVADQATMSLPDTGTPADLLFGSVLDMNAPSFLFTLNQAGQTVMKFTGLDPAMTYRFQTFGARGRQDDAPDRWSMCTIQGAAAFEEAFTSAGGTNAISKSTFPSSTLTSAQIAWNSGRNADAGDLIGWDKIVPAADGTFSVATEQYTGPVPSGTATGAYGYGLAGFQLIESGAYRDVSLAEQPAATTTVEQTRPFALSVRVAGSSPKLQWYKQGVGAIAGATHPTFSVDSSAVSDSGVYYAVAANSSSSVTSILAQVTVFADTTLPTVTAANGAGAFDSLDTIYLTFSEPVQGADNTASYTVEGLTVSSVVYNASKTNAAVTLNKPLTVGQSYSVTVKNIKDMAGNTMATATIPVNTYVIASGFLRWEYWGGLSTSDNVLDNTLVADARYPKNPDSTSFLSAFDSRTIFPDDTHEGYGSRTSAYFIPPTSGNWTFFIRSDDSSRLFLNKNGTDPAGKEVIAEESDCCEGFVEPGTLNDDGETSATSEPIALTAGQRYYIEAIHKEGGGGDYVQVAARLENDTTPAGDLKPLPGKYFEALADASAVSLSITQQPASITVVNRGAQGGPTTLRSEAFNTTDGGFTSDSGTATAPDAPWTWDGSAAWACSSPGDAGPYATHLTSPAITVASAGTVSLSFDHRYSFEDASTFYDGGVVQISVNGGSFTTVGATNFTANGYKGPLTGTHEISNLPAFAGTSTGYDEGTYLTSTAYLGTFSAGDTIAVRFVAAWDANTEGTEPNWEITGVKLELGTVAPIYWTTFKVAAASTYQGVPSTFLSYTWQRDDGSGFKDITTGDFISPLNQPYLTVKAQLADNGAKFRCIVQGVLKSVTSEVATLTVTTNAVVDKPTLSVQRSGASLLISWPLTASGFTLQQSAALPATAWTAVPASSYTTSATNISVTVTPTGSAFYRLSQ